jgi:hypothetical protein
MPAAIVKLVGNYDRRPSEQRVKWIGDLYFASQIPGSGERAAAMYSILQTARRTMPNGLVFPRILRDRALIGSA